jgi:hypothetical protein
VRTDHRPHGLGLWGSCAGFVVVFVTLVIAGCGNDPPDCNPPVLTNEQEAALVRSTLATTEGMVATAQDSLAADIVAIASDYQAQHDELVDPEPCDDRTAVLLNYQLIVVDLIANADTISPELAAGLTRASHEGGAAGVTLFLSDSEAFLGNEYPGLAEMRDRLRPRRDRADEVFDGLDEPTE